MDEPEERDYFESAVEPMLDDDVEFVGEIADAERAQLLGDAIGLINPISWDEPFGLVMVEALACGTPTLAFARGAAPEIVGDGIGGLLCLDVDEAVRSLPDLAALDRTVVRDRASTLFSTDRMVDRHVELYESLVAGWPFKPAPSASIALDAPAASAESAPVR
jgi:glycosyltransferase involved in cell wall biosynthesis